MKIVFADTGYWIALLDPQDSLHSKVIEISLTLEQDQIYTSEMVLTEVLNHFSKQGIFLRRAAASFIQAAQQNPAIKIFPQTTDLFQQAFALYRQRLDKSWSHTDCASFLIMRQQNVLAALAYDKHFEQAGFVALLR
ncbi:MAG: type II toxin-antitoxin system VapC family toxin [Almyronema sp.]